MSDAVDRDRSNYGGIDRSTLLRRAGTGALALAIPGAAAAPAGARRLVSRRAAASGAKEIERLTWGVSANIRSLFLPNSYDVQTSMVVSAALEGLLTTGSDGKLRPSLAESWRQTDAVTYVYKIRRGVTFWDGTPLTAEDIAFSMARNLDPKAASAVSPFYGSVKSIEATGPLEVTIKLKFPDQTFQYTPGHSAGLVVSKRFFEAHEKDIGTPGVLTMGTGAYRITKYVPDESVTLVRNERYWGRKPAVKEAVLRFITDDATRLLALRAGEIDGSFQVPLSQAAQWQRVRDVKVLFFPSQALGMFTFNTQKPPWNDIHVRRAFAYAIDKQGLISAVLRGHGKPANAIPPPEQWGGLLSKVEVRRFYATLPQYRFDLEKAKAEVAQSAFPDGFEATVPYSAGFPQIGKAALSLSQNLKKLGIRLRVKELTAEKWRADLIAHKNLGMNSWLIFPDFPDPVNNPQYILHSKFAGWPNPAFYKNAKVDRLLNQQAKTVNPRRRAALIKEIVRTAQEDLPYLPMWYEEQAIAIRSNLVYEGPSAWWFFQPWLTHVRPAG
jgi:peptide/nickel transport system substrate-binding protein